MTDQVDQGIQKLRIWARRVSDFALAVLVAIAVTLVLAVVVVPAMAGGFAVTVLSGSMEPTLHVGAVVVDRPLPPSGVAVGDIITFTSRRPETGASRVVTHRVIGVEAGPVFRTKGDANPTADPTPVPIADVRGVEWYSIPLVGGLRDRLVTPVGAAIVGGLALLIVAVRLLVGRPRRSSGMGPCE